MLATDKLLIIGCGGHARSVADVALSLGISNLIFWDINARENETLFTFPVVADSSLFHICKKLFIAIGDNKERADYFEKLKEKKLHNIISAHAYIAISATIGRGIFIAHGAHVGPMACVGDNTIINTRAVIEHECAIGAHSHISVNATITGRCQIEDFVFIGAGAVVKDKVSICSNVTVGAGAVVVKDIIEPGIYVGSPARKIK